MADRYVLDACALIAALTEEEGTDVVAGLFARAISNPDDVEIAMHRINILEVYYDAHRRFGKERADSFLKEMKSNPIAMVSDLSDDFLREAGSLKSENRISLADAIALTLAKRTEAKLLTSDHHEMDSIAAKGEITFAWIR